MPNFYPCKNCNGTMNGRYCEDCGFDEMQFINEWEEFVEETDDQEAA